MRKYIANRLLRSLFSISIVIVIVYILIYSLVPKQNIFNKDPDYQKKAGDALTQYVYKTYEDYGYGDYITFGDYCGEVYPDKGSADFKVCVNSETKKGN